MVQRVNEIWDKGSGLFHIHYTEDVGPVLDEAALFRNHAVKEGYKKNAARWRLVGKIPNIILDQWFREGFNALDPKNERELTKRLSGDYKKFLYVDKI